MGEKLISDFIAGDSKEIRDLASNEAALVGFLTLLKGIDDLPEVSHRFYESTRSLYQVTASKYPIDELMGILSDYFGAPAKAPGKTIPVSLRFDHVVKYLGGVRENQVLFLKKLKTGAFYGALWPWQREKEQTEILLGFHSTSMSDSDYEQLETLVNQFLSQKKIESVSGVGGQIHGISLPSFLQMSEMEGTTYTLKVSHGNRVGYLYVNGGSLIAAKLDNHTGNKAAYRIISWDNASIQIEPAEPDREREIHDPLMHVMMESLKIKDESGADLPTTVPDVEVPEPSPAPLSEDTLQLDPPPMPEDRKPAQEVSVPANKQSHRKTTQEVTPLSEDYEPFEKHADRSIGMQNKMSRTNKLLIVLGIVILFAVSVTAGGQLMKKREASRRYDQLRSNLSTAEALDAKIVLLMQYIKAHPEDTHRSELENQLAGTYTEIEQLDYDDTVADVNDLKIDEKFEKRALSLYTAFLTKYPDSAYVDQIDKAKDGIGLLMGTAYFENLKKVAATDFLERYEAYRLYLKQFPQGEERKVVEQMISDLAAENTGTIKKQMYDCDQKEDWDPCIEQCDRFLSWFTHSEFVEEVKKLRAMLQDKKDLFNMAVKAASAKDDYAKAKRVYTDYLKNKPETTQKEAILQRIETLTADLAKKNQWAKTKAFATDPANDIFSRTQRLNGYLESQDSSPYESLAKKLRSKLDPELQATLRSRQKEEYRRREAMRQQAQAENNAKKIQRINRIQNNVIRQLQPLKTRFEAHQNGTVTDRVTGLTWCLLDSYLVLNTCISYESAKKYVQSLGSGGHSDWRLPTAGELATLYKNSPFFPDTGAPWYWTAESFARGFHQVVDVVTSEQETTFTRMTKSEKSCGAVRAVLR